ncbi:MAG TPA: penicillin-binding protein activator, partial [Casimicrobiaceae bacterium]
MRPFRFRDFRPLHMLQALATLTLFAAAAFCAAQDAPASNAPAAMDAAPASGDAQALPSMQPSPAQTLPLQPPPAPVPMAPDIALVLPLDATDYARAAEAVRAGFLDAAQAAGATSRVNVIGHGDSDSDIVAAFQKARDAGAHVIVGPLVRDQLRVLANANLDLPPTIALNQLDDGTPLPPLVYTLALAIESDARVVARRAREDGATRAAVIVSAAPLMTRFAGAFSG